MIAKAQIRRARPEEATMLTELAMRSKAHWPYDAAFLAEVRPELEVRPERFQPDFHVYVLEEHGTIVGFCSLIPKGPHAVELEDLFIEPAHIGKGYGKQLWDYALDLARGLGYRKLTLVADPYAEPFYARRGAVRTGEKQSLIHPDRMLPLMECRLA